MSSYGSTDLTVASGSGDNGGTDLYYRYQSLPPGNLAKYSCQGVSSGWRCGHAHILIDNTQVSGFTVNQMRTVFWHETGHGVGLLHGADGEPPLSNDDPAIACMRTPISAAVGLANHNVAHINYHY